MVLTVTQYLEAFDTPDGRLRSLPRLRMVRDGVGEAAFSVPAPGLVDFMVEAGGERLTLRCPLRVDGSFATRLRAFAERDNGLGGRFFTEWRLMEREVLLFGFDGATIEVDVLARPTPRGVPLADFLGEAVARGDWDVVCRASESFEELARWAAGVPRAVSLKRILAAPDGEVTVDAFSVADGTAHVRELLCTARRRLGIAEPRLPAYPERNMAVAGVLAAKAVGAEGTTHVPAPSAPELPDSYEEARWDAEWGVAVVMARGRWSLLDCDGATISVREYEWLGDCSEGLLLAVRDGRCGFVDTSGNEVIPCVWDDASSFAEGCALVVRGSESFFINQRGKRI